MISFSPILLFSWVLLDQWMTNVISNTLPKGQGTLTIEGCFSEGIN